MQALVTLMSAPCDAAFRRDYATEGRSLGALGGANLAVSVALLVALSTYPVHTLAATGTSSWRRSTLGEYVPDLQVSDGMRVKSCLQSSLHGHALDALAISLG